MGTRSKARQRIVFSCIPSDGLSYQILMIAYI